MATESIVEKLLNGRPYQTPKHKYSFDETRDALNLIRSYLWRVKELDTKPLLVTTAHTYDAILDALEKDETTRDDISSSRSKSASQNPVP